MNKIKIKSWIDEEKKILIISVLLLINLVGFVLYCQHFINKGYLPSPFLYNKTDTFMDFYNALYWSLNDQRYTEWKSVYPPLNFIILRFIDFLFAGITLDSPIGLRENFPYLVLSVIVLFIVSNALILKTKYWKDFNKNEKILLFLSFIISSPVLFSVERGNLILICPVLLFLAINSFGIKRSLFIALLINIKPYFFILNIYYLIKKDWKGFLNSILLSGLIYALTSIILGSEFFEFFKNIFDFSQNKSIFSLREVMAMPSSISAFSFVLKNESGAAFAKSYIALQNVHMLIYTIEIFKWMALLVSIIAILRSADKITDLEVFAVIILIISNMNIWIGGYIYIMYIILVPIFMKMRANNFYIACLLLIAMPLDFIPLTNEYIGFQMIYLTNLNTNIHWTLGLGSVLRPILNILLLVAVSTEILIRMNNKESFKLVRNEYQK